VISCANEARKISLQGVSKSIVTSIGSNLQLADAVVLGTSAVKNVRVNFPYKIDRHQFDNLIIGGQKPESRLNIERRNKIIMPAFCRGIKGLIMSVIPWIQDFPYILVTLQLVFDSSLRKFTRYYGLTSHPVPSIIMPPPTLFDIYLSITT